jgi:hypothetical protein
MNNERKGSVGRKGTVGARPALITGLAAVLFASLISSAHYLNGSTQAGPEARSPDAPGAPAVETGLRAPTGLSGPDARTIAPQPAAEASRVGFRYPSLEYPSLEEYRGEVHARHHGAPRALMIFARQLAGEMEKAQASGEYAARLFGDLSRCALDAAANPVPAARAMCAVNAARLGARDPRGLGERFRGLRGELPEEISDLVLAMGY